VLGQVTLPPTDGSAKTLRKLALIALAGKLWEGAPHWPPAWPLVGPVTPDERDLFALVKMLGLNQRQYHDLVRDAFALLVTKRFDRFATAVADRLERHHHLDQRMIKAIREGVDDDADRDELGVISDAQVEKDREQLRRQRAEGTGMVLSNNGDTPRKSLGDGLYEALVGTHVNVADFEC
jgi:hypothetical protein